MYCQTPIGIPNEDTGTVSYFPCGKCPICCRNHQKEWMIRIQEEFKASIQSRFITLTYEDDCLYRCDNGMPGFDKRNVKKYIHALHERAKYAGVNLRHFVVSEYGRRTGRPHHHMMIFLDNPIEDLDEWLLKRPWPYGFVKIDLVTPGRVKYITKYCLKDWPNNMDWDLFPPECKPFTLMSQGIGKQYMSDNVRRYHLDASANYYTSDSGAIQKLPRYYMDRIFEPTDRDAMQQHARDVIDHREVDALRRQGYKKIRKYVQRGSDEYVYTQIVPLDPQRSEDLYMKKTLALYNHLVDKWQTNDLL